MNEKMKEVLSTSIYLLIVLLVSYLFVHFVGQRTLVNGVSMEDTLQDGDNLLVDKISYRFHDPERFDVIVFKYTHKDNTYYVKRIIGLPGETVQIDNAGNIYINGKEIEEHYGFETIKDPGIAANPITLGEDEFFVLGDNRNNSADSRMEAVGNINRKIIVGRAWVRIWPLHNAGKVEDIK
ncbi:signal peptidase I [Lachnospiraceae bacterium XBB2008]|nr:signal peptidase I [Lachnospiraceae bacterium XBB2008]